MVSGISRTALAVGLDIVPDIGDPVVAILLACFTAGADMDSSPQNMLRDLGRIVWVTATCATGVGLLVNAAIVLL